MCLGSGQKTGEGGLLLRFVDLLDPRLQTIMFAQQTIMLGVFGMKWNNSAISRAVHATSPSSFLLAIFRLALGNVDAIPPSAAQRLK
jgi:hypothetical protein